MSICQTIHIPKTKICIADLDKRVQVLKRSIVAPLGQSVYVNVTSLEARHNFQTVSTVWAAIKNIKGDAILDSVSTNDIPTHWFYMRYREDIDKDNWLSFKNEYYRILEVVNFQEDNLFLQIKTIKTGSTAKGASQV